MPRARINVNGDHASRIYAVPINTPVLLSNDNVGDETSYIWQLVDQPEGTADALDNTTITNPTFTPKKEGSYLIRLVVDIGLGTQATTTTIVYIADARTNERVPAAYETTEAGLSRGWASAADHIFQRTLTLAADGNVLACANASSPNQAAVGDIVYIAGTSTLHAGLPGAATIPLIALSKATVADNVVGPMGVVIGTPSGGSPVADGLVLVRRFGIVEPTETGAPSIGDTVYVSDTAQPSLTPGTNPRKIGRVIHVAGGAWIWLVDAGANGATGASSPQLNDITNNEVVTVAIGAPVYINANAGFQRAKADNAATGRTIGLLLATIAAGASAPIATSGPITLTTAQWDAICGTTGGLAFDVPYYLDANTAGMLTATPPSVVGQVVQKIMTAVSATEAVIDIGEPDVIGSSGNLIPLINASGVTMIACEPVYSSGAASMSPGLADNSGKSRIVGLLTTSTVANGATGIVCCGGLMVATMAQWDAICGTTGGLTNNVPYYLDKATPGRLTATPPVTPADDGKEVVQVITALSATLARIAITPAVLL